jgi:conjugative relaxase-like TrwC/TraI family protein
MLSISNPLSGAGVANYYKEHAQASYYANDLSQPGEWYGRGTGRLKLQGKVDFEIFDRLLQGFDRTGRIPLVQNAGHENRAQGWDLTFSAPKSVSVLWALAPEDVRQQIAAAHRAAVCQALDFVQDHAAITRRGKGGTRHEKAEVAFALFQHGVSRAQDPQLHIHCVLLNLACRQDGSVGALHSQPLFDEKMATGAVYQARLAAELQQRLNLALQSERKSFRILNVPAELCSHFSKRRRAIVKFMQQHGLAGAVAAKAATLLTRPRKQHLPPERVRAAWIEVGRQFGWGEEQIRELIEQSKHARQEPTHAAAPATSTKSPPQTAKPDDGLSLSPLKSPLYLLDSLGWLDAFGRLRLPQSLAHEPFMESLAGSKPSATILLNQATAAFADHRGVFPIEPSPLLHAV